MKTMMLTLAAFAATAAAADHPLYVMVTGTCPTKDMMEVDGVPMSVCGATSAREGKFCTKMFGKTKAVCYIPDCYVGTVPKDADGNFIDKCNIDQLAKPVDDVSIVRAKSLMPTTVTSGFAAFALTNELNSMGQRWGWPDVPKSAFLNFPESLVGRMGQVPNVYIGDGFEIKMKCFFSGEGNKCDVFAFIYRCPPCTFANGGNFPLALLADDWTPYTCDVKFMLDQTVPTHQHEVVVYHKQITKGESINIAPTDILELSWYAIGAATAHCEDYDMFQCATELPKECKWDSGANTCRRVLCPKPDVPSKPQGPFVNKCNVCVDDERAMYMPTLI